MLSAVLLFSKLNDFFLDTLIRKIFPKILGGEKPGNVIDISAKKEALAVCCSVLLRHCACVAETSHSQNDFSPWNSECEVPAFPERCSYSVRLQNPQLQESTSANPSCEGAGGRFSAQRCVSADGVVGVFANLETRSLSGSEDIAQEIGRASCRERVLLMV